jgi:hypothetical protein
MPGGSHNITRLGCHPLKKGDCCVGGRDGGLKLSNVYGSLSDLAEEKNCEVLVECFRSDCQGLQRYFLSRSS